jgi:hypothetical protein
MTGSVLSRVQDLSTDMGWRGVLRIAPRWLVCRRYFGVVADLHGLDLERPRPPEIRVAPLGAREVPALSEVVRTMTRDEVARRLDEGQQCTLGWWGEELAHVRWDSTVPVYLPYLGRVLRPGPGDQIVVGIHTAPAFRGRQLAGAVMMDTARRARAAGVSRLVWLVAWWNVRSLALTDQLVSQVQGTVGYWALGPCRRYFASGRVRLGADGAVCIDEVARGVRRPDARPAPPASGAKRQC